MVTWSCWPGRGRGRGEDPGGRAAGAWPGQASSEAGDADTEAGEETGDEDRTDEEDGDGHSSNSNCVSETVTSKDYVPLTEKQRIKETQYKTQCEARLSTRLSMKTISLLDEREKSIDYLAQISLLCDVAFVAVFEGESLPMNTWLNQFRNITTI